MKIKMTCLLVALLFCGATVAHAQSSDEINRVEFFGGFSHNRLDTGLTSEDIGTEFDETFGGRRGANGFNASITGNVSKYVGLKFDFATHGTSDDVTFDGDQFRTKYRINNFLGGIQVKNNKQESPRVKPFFHALAGVARQSITVEGAALQEALGETSFNFKETNFALAIGGGLDVRVSRRVDVRVFQVDYNPTYIKERDFDDFVLDGKLQNNVRFSFGIVIH